MDRRAFMGNLGVYGATVAAAREVGTPRAPKLKIREIRCVRMRGINQRFVRVYTDQGLTGTGECLDTIGAEDIINKFFSPGLADRDPFDIESTPNPITATDSCTSRTHPASASRCMTTW